MAAVPWRRRVRGGADHSARRGTHCAPLGGISSRRAISACNSPRKRAQSSRRSSETKSPGSLGSHPREISGSSLGPEIAPHLHSESVEPLVRTAGAASGRSSGDCRARLYGVSRGVGSLKWGMPGDLSRKERELLQPGRRLCVGLVGHRVEGALDPIGLRSDPWSVLNLGRMREDPRVSANRFDQRDVE